MVALNSDFAASKPNTDTKNRVGDFLGEVAEFVGEGHRSTFNRIREKQVCDYDLTSSHCFGPFGELIRATGEKKDAFNFRFSTKYEDAETGLLYYGYRYYNPETERWLNRDPIDENGGLNLYGFIGNDSVNYADYLGLTLSVDPTLKGPGIRNTLTGRIASRADFRAQINRINGPSTSLNPRAAHALTVSNLLVSSGYGMFLSWGSSNALNAGKALIDRLQIKLECAGGRASRGNFSFAFDSRHVKVP